MCTVDVILIDYGGVLAEEGFREGLRAIARNHRLEEEPFILLGHDLVHRTGYVQGKADEGVFWEAIRESAGIQADDETLRSEILSRFVLRDWMLALMGHLKGSHRIGLLSDQTNWLDELDARDGFLGCFDFVFNSYRMGKTKVDPSHFDDVLSMLRVDAGRVLFVDDNRGHCDRAGSRGINTIHYVDKSDFIRELSDYCPGACQEPAVCPGENEGKRQAGPDR
jgi:putative hydrolase of the HAD superfamily